MRLKKIDIQLKRRHECAFFSSMKGYIAFSSKTKHFNKNYKKNCFFIYQKDTRGKRLYIATQGKLHTYGWWNIYCNFHILDFCGFYMMFLFISIGPKPKTIADFWTMIWQEEVCQIVCLTNLTEGTKVGVYWRNI